jgi:hypothetical protein
VRLLRFGVDSRRPAQEQAAGRESAFGMLAELEAVKALEAPIEETSG